MVISAKELNSRFGCCWPSRLHEYLAEHILKPKSNHIQKRQSQDSLGTNKHLDLDNLGTWVKQKFNPWKDLTFEDDMGISNLFSLPSGKDNIVENSETKVTSSKFVSYSSSQLTKKELSSTKQSLLQASTPQVAQIKERLLSIIWQGFIELFENM